MKKLFISQPMRGKTNDKIILERQKILEKLNGVDASYYLIDSVINEPNSNPITLLGRSIELMADADVILFMSGWENARGCVIEHQVAVSYNKEIIYYN